jgi:hypothetical protein
MKRCNECKNCIKLEKVKLSILRHVNHPFSHASQDVIDVWNDMVEYLPCKGISNEKSYS